MYPLIIGAFFFITCCALLVFMIARPTQWARLVDAENDFWLRTGLVPQKLTSQVRKFEKGRGLKILVIIGAFVSLLLMTEPWILWLILSHR